MTTELRSLGGCHRHPALQDPDCYRCAQIRMKPLGDRTDRVAELERALADRDATIARVRALHRPDGGSGGPGAMCVTCTPDFGTQHEEPVAWPCSTIAALDGGAS